MEITIREEKPEDASSIREVNDRAFGQPLEGRLVDLLRANGGVLLSLVAVNNADIVGHILFSPVTLDSDGGELLGAGLGPMAVLPELQCAGIGSSLVREGIDRIRSRRVSFIVVLGHPEYYPRFGFVRASQYGVSCQWDVPDEAFMLLRLSDDHGSGLAKYRDEFMTVA